VRAGHSSGRSSIVRCFEIQFGDFSPDPGLAVMVCPNCNSTALRKLSLIHAFGSYE
jgi:hypothetical protein